MAEGGQSKARSEPMEKSETSSTGVVLPGSDFRSRRDRPHHFGSLVVNAAAGMSACRSGPTTRRDALSPTPTPGSKSVPSPVMTLTNPVNLISPNGVTASGSGTSGSGYPEMGTPPSLAPFPRAVWEDARPRNQHSKRCLLRELDRRRRMRRSRSRRRRIRVGNGSDPRRQWPDRDGSDLLDLARRLLNRVPGCSYLRRLPERRRWILRRQRCRHRVGWSWSRTRGTWGQGRSRRCLGRSRSALGDLWTRRLQRRGDLRSSAGW